MAEKNDILLRKANNYAHGVYRLSKHFPDDELYGITSQLRRAALSVPLNIVEGYARQSVRSQTQFLRISYASLKESQFLLEFSYEENLMEKDQYIQIITQGDELARILWSKTRTLESKNSVL